MEFGHALAMKSKDLQAPYPFEERFPCIRERIFYIPIFYPHYEEFSLPSWRDLFGDDKPVHVEYCSGNGEWVLKKALQCPNINWVAVELKFSRVRKIHSKRENYGIHNLFIVCGKAQIFAQVYLPTNSVERVYVNFPDPWPKKRHAKHRLVCFCFAQSVLRTVRPEGTLRLVSDAFPYIEQMKTEIGKIPEWQLFVTSDEQNYGSSYFDRLWRSKGRKIYYLDYRCIKK